ncbi:MAG: response regulator [Myxococcota bacterium]
MRRTLEVLLVEDSESDAKLLRLRLRDHPELALSHAATLAEALARASERVPDAVLLDLALPDAVGLDGLTRLREAVPTVPIVILTGRDDEAWVAEAARLGAQDYLLKDELEPRVLLRSVRYAVERMRIGERLRRSEARWRSLVESMNDLVFTLDPEARISGTYGGGDARRGLGADLLAARVASGPEARAACARALRGEHAVYEARFEQGGESRCAEVSLAPLVDTYGHIVEVVAVSRDVTAHRRLEAEVLTAERMSAIGHVAAAVGHEINNPLSAVVGNLDVAVHDLARVERRARLERGAPDRALASAMEAVEDARGAAELVRRIVRDLKVFSREERAQPAAVPVARALESARRMARNEIRHRARVVAELGPAPLVVAQESRLAQVALNLLVNAAHALDEGKVDDNQIRVTLGTDARGWAVFTVEDTGCGMTPEVLAHVFDPFFTTKPPGLGSGLGVPICQRIVAELGGELGFESEPGRGTVARVALPPAPASSERAPPDEGAGVGGARDRRIVVIDDDPSFLRFVARALGREHSVVTFAHAADALRHLSDGAACDVIVCDVMMPHVSGPVFVEALRDARPDLVERVVFITGGAFTPAARRYLDALAEPWLEKPIALADLEAAVARVARA